MVIVLDNLDPTAEWLVDCTCCPSEYNQWLDDCRSGINYALKKGCILSAGPLAAMLTFP